MTNPSIPHDFGFFLCYGSRQEASYDVSLALSSVAANRSLDAAPFPHLLRQVICRDWLAICVDRSRQSVRGHQLRLRLQSAQQDIQGIRLPHVILVQECHERGVWA